MSRVQDGNRDPLRGSILFTTRAGQLSHASREENRRKNGDGFLRPKDASTQHMRNSQAFYGVTDKQSMHKRHIGRVYGK